MPYYPKNLAIGGKPDKRIPINREPMPKLKLLPYGKVINAQYPPTSKISTTTLKGRISRRQHIQYLNQTVGDFFPGMVEARRITTLQSTPPPIPLKLKVSTSPIPIPKVVESPLTQKKLEEIIEEYKKSRQFHLLPSRRKPT